MFICVHLWLLSLSLFSTTAQVRPVNDYGALGLAQLLKRLNTTASVMMIGAHPDDEDSALLAYLARGESARTAYLSLTRGDGGQNIIGPELFEALGVIRTEELLQARRLDGAEQYFTRAFDYGFSKTLAEAKSKWPEDVIKCDVVRAIRLFRPMVVISRFTGTPADGHGQHQYAGYITPIAVKAAADPQQCKESGEPWQVLKFYVEQGFGDNLPTPTLRINTGQYDPILGRSYFEIAMEGRSMHRSQGEGRLAFHGDQFSGLNLVGVEKDTRERSIFEGIDTSLTGLAEILRIKDEENKRDLREMERLIKDANSGFQQSNPDVTLSSLVSLIKLLPTVLRANIQAIPSNPGSTIEYQLLSDELSAKREQTKAAVKLATGVRIDALADSEMVVPGENLFVAVKTYLPQNSPLKVKSVEMKFPPKWISTKAEEPKENNPGFVRRETATVVNCFSVSIPSDAELTQPYWLELERNGDTYQWPAYDYRTLPFQPPLAVAAVTIEIDGTSITLNQPVQFRYADPQRGEMRRELNVVPPVSVGVEPKLIIATQSNKPQTKVLNVVVRKNICKPLVHSGRIVSGVYGEDWKFTYPRQEINLNSCEEKVHVPISFTIPPGTIPRNYTVWGGVWGEDFSDDKNMNIVTYPHIQTHRYYSRPWADLRIIDLKTAPAKVGYIMGSGDEVPEAIRQMGLDVTMLEEKDLASGDLSKFETIVVGIRASETRADMMANKQRLLDYVNGGGNLIMQYQRGNFSQSGLAPFPIDTTDKQGTTAGSVARVVDENAPVKILEPANPVFNFPNKITDEDFKGWVQERNAYNLVTFDPKYTPLLESHDAGEQENKGGLVIAKVGKGNWVYCSYSFFRQLPAGVPGAYRLFANLLSLRKAVAEVRTK